MTSNLIQATNSQLKKVVIQRATLSDIDALLTICHDSFPFSIRWQSPHILGKQWWKSVLTSISAETWLIVQDSNIVAFSVIVVDALQWRAGKQARGGHLISNIYALVLHPRLAFSKVVRKIRPAGFALGKATQHTHPGSKNDKPFWIELIAVTPYMRRLGLAKSLLQFCESRAVELNRPRIGLRVDLANNAAYRLYEQLGFVCTRQTPSEKVYMKTVRGKESVAQ